MNGKDQLAQHMQSITLPQNSVCGRFGIISPGIDRDRMQISVLNCNLCNRIDSIDVSVQIT